MRKKLIISEKEKRNILKLYNLLNEQRPISLPKYQPSDSYKVDPNYDSQKAMSQLRAATTPSEINIPNDKGSPSQEFITQNETIRSFISNLSIPFFWKIPLHFMTLRTKPLKNDEVPPEVINTFSKILCEKSIRKGSCDPSEWKGVSEKVFPKEDDKNSFFYADATYYFSESPTYKSSTNLNDQSEPIKNICLTIGRANVKKEGNNWVIDDKFDFDNRLDNNKWLKVDNPLKENSLVLKLFDMLKIFSFGYIGVVRGFIEWILGRGPQNGFEMALSQYHNLGYKGYNNNWTIPIGNCKCNKTQSTK